MTVTEEDIRKMDEFMEPIVKYHRERDMKRAEFINKRNEIYRSRIIPPYSA